MNEIKRIIFWEPSISPHKMDFFNAIAKIQPKVEVICCAQTNVEHDRKLIGWEIKINYNFEVLIAPDKSKIDLLINEMADSTLNIFSGIRWVPIIIDGLKSVKHAKANFAIMSEPRVREGFVGFVRFIHSWATERYLRKNVQFILAQGANGPAWFKSVGYPKNKIFLFAYFVDPPQKKSIRNRTYHDNSQLKNYDSLIKIAFVGRLIKMKGIFYLVQAVSLMGRSVQLTIVGSGPEEGMLRRKCEELGINVSFLGVLPIARVGAELSKQDVLVLPSISKDDGWGVVVSEALMSGTAVVCTSCVGASIVLEHSIFGIAVPIKSAKSIANAIHYLKSHMAFTSEVRSRRALLAKQLLSSESGARHLMEIIKWRFNGGERPISFVAYKPK